MSPQQRGQIWALVTMNAVIWSSIFSAVLTGHTHFPWWILPVVMAVSAAAGLAVGASVARRG